MEEKDYLDFKYYFFLLFILINFFIYGKVGMTLPYEMQKRKKIELWLVFIVALTSYLFKSTMDIEPSLLLIIDVMFIIAIVKSH